MKHDIKIYKTMIQLSMILSTIAFYYECCKSGRKRGGKGVGWKATLNQGESSSFPGTCHVRCGVFFSKIKLISLSIELAIVEQSFRGLF